MGRRRRAESDQMVLVEVLDFAGLRVLSQIVRRGVGVEMHGEQAASNQVRLARLAQSQRDVRFAHPEVEVVVRQQELQLDLGVEVDELAEPRRQPIGTEAERRRDPQFAVRLLTAVDEARAHGVELEDYVAHGAEQHFALFSQNESAGMAMKQRRAEVGLQRPNLAADRRLTEP